MNECNANLTAVSIKKICKSFGNNEVLKDININIEPGEFFTLLGSSGCGKTTLLRCIAGLEKPTSGNIYFDEEDVGLLNPWEKNTGFVFQNYALWPHKTIYENIAYGLRIRKKSKKEIENAIQDALEMIELPDVEKRYPNQLSGGQQQRIAIARALVIQPQVLLLDEPLSNLDAKLRIKMRQDIKMLQKKLGITTIYVTHDQEEALEISDRIAIFNGGVIQQVASPEEVYQNPVNQFVANFVGKSNFIKGDVTRDTFTTNAGTVISKGLKTERQGKAILSFRPENTTIVSDTSEGINGIVRTSFYRGANYQYIVDIDEKSEVSLEYQGKLRTGQKIKFTIDKIQIFND